jgi:hypothetical protein
MHEMGWWRQLMTRESRRRRWRRVLLPSVGGMVAFGLVGIFVGPVVLGVAYTLLNAWIDSGGEGDHGG